MHDSSSVRWSDKEEVLQAVRTDGENLQWASEGLRADREVVLEAVAQNGKSLQHAAEELRSEKAFILQAVALNGLALQWAGWVLRADKAVVLQAVTQAGAALQWAAGTLRADKEVVLQAVAKDGSMLPLAASKLLADKEVVLQAVTNKPDILRCASLRLRSDKDFVEACALASLDATCLLHSDFRRPSCRLLLVRALSGKSCAVIVDVEQQKLVQDIKARIQVKLGITEVNASNIRLILGTEPLDDGRPLRSVSALRGAGAINELLCIVEMQPSDA